MPDNTFIPVTRDQFLQDIRAKLPDEQKDIGDYDLWLNVIKKYPEVNSYTFLNEQDAPSLREELGLQVTDFMYNLPKNFTAGALAVVSTLESGLLQPSTFSDVIREYLPAQKRLKIYKAVSDFMDNARKVDKDIAIMTIDEQPYSMNIGGLSNILQQEEAIRAWNKENPYEWSRSFEGPMIGRALGSVIASMGTIAGTAGAFGPMAGFVTAFAIEGGNTYDELVQELESKGYDKEQIDRYASYAAMMYGSVSMMLEALVPMAIMRGAGFGKYGTQASKKLIGRFIEGRLAGETVEEATEAVIKKSASNLSILGKVEELAKAAKKSRFFGIVAEPSTEGLQFLSEEAIKDGYVSGEEITMEWLGSKLQDPEFKESVFGGLLGGGSTLFTGGESKTKEPEAVKNIRQEVNKAKQELETFAEEEGLSTEGIKAPKVLTTLADIESARKADLHEAKRDFENKTGLFSKEDTEEDYFAFVKDIHAKYNKLAKELEYDKLSYEDKVKELEKRKKEALDLRGPYYDDDGSRLSYHLYHKKITAEYNAELAELKRMHGEQEVQAESTKEINYRNNTYVVDEKNKTIVNKKTGKTINATSPVGRNVLNRMYSEQEPQTEPTKIEKEPTLKTIVDEEKAAIKAAMDEAEEKFSPTKLSESEMALKLSQDIGEFGEEILPKEANVDAYLSEGEEVLPPEAKKGMPKSMVEQILGKQAKETKAEQLPPEATSSGNEWMAKALGLNIAEESKLEEKLSNEAKKNGSQYNKTITEANDELYQSGTNIGSERIKYNAQKYKKIRKFLKKKYPSLKVELLDNVYSKYGYEVAGKIVGNLIQISKSKATMDTLPHEYVHAIIIALRDDPIVKLGIKKFASALKTDITLNEVERLQDKYFGKGGKANEEMMQLVAESSPERIKKILNLLDSLRKEGDTFEDLNYNSTLVGLRSLVTQAAGLATAPEWVTKSVSERRKAYQEEQLVQVVGEYLANRITDTTLRNRIRVWLKQLLAKARKAFGMLKEEDIKVLIGERIYKGDVPGAVDTSGEYYQEVSDMENEESDTPDEHDTATDSGTFKDFKAIFSTIFSTNISTGQYKYIQDLAVEIFNNKTEQNNDNGFIEFKNYVEAYMQNEYVSGNIERLYIPREGKELIRYTNELKKMYLQANNKIPRYRGIREKARIYHDIIFDKKTKKVHSQEEAIDELTGRTIDLRDHSLKPLYMMKNLVEVRNSMDKTKDRINSIFLGFVQSYSLLDKYIYKKKGKEYVRFRDRWGGFTIKDLDALNDSPGNENIVFIGSKQGDNSSVIFAYTPLFMKGWTEEQARKYLIEEINKHVDEKYKKDVFNIFKDSAATFSKHGWRKMATQHHTFKTIFHNKYLNWQIEEKGLYDLFNRLRVALSEGIVPYGIGDSKVMLVKGKDITVRTNGIEESMSLSDGWMLSGRQFMKRVEDVVGAVPEDNKQHGLGSFKGAITVRSENGEDYGMFKMLNSVPLENMELIKDGKVIAKYDSEKGVWIDSKGNEFDHVVSDNEAKVTAGKFKDALDSNEIMTIPEHAIMIQQIPSQKSKRSSAFPVNVSEMIWTIDENILNEFKKYYRQIANKYLTPLFKGIKEPKYLRELLYRESDNPSQLQKLMEIDKSGNTIRLPGMIELASFMLNHRIIRKGYFQARDEDNSSLAYLKPAFGMGLKNDEISISSENSIVYNKIKELSKLSNVDEMNKWLEKNEVNIMVSRQPVAREDGVRVYRIKKLVNGGHADAVFMSFDVVTKVLDGDYDGDKVQLNFATKELLDAMKGLNKKFEEHNKPALTDIFKDTRGKRITASIEQVKKTIEEQGVGKYSQGIMVNAKVINGLLAYKGFKIDYTVGSGKNQKRFSIRIKKPTDRVVMDYIELKDDITEKDIANGDKIITRNGKKYLETNLAHELSYLLQFAVDDPKLGFLTQIGWNGQPFVMNRIFDVTLNGMRINLKNYTGDMHLIYKGRGILNNLYNMFKYSPIRHGRTSSRDIASMAINLRNSRDIYKDYFSGKTLEERAASIKDKLIDNTGLKAEQVKFAMNENVSPMESLLSELGRMYDDWRKENPDFVEAYDEIVDENGAVIKQAENRNTPFHKQEDMYRILHNMATQDLILNIGDMLMEDEFAKARKSMKQKEDTKIAKEFKNELVKDFYTAFAQIAENKNKYGEVLSINYQYNEAFVRLREKYENRFNKMTPSQQMLSTMYFLSTPYKQNKYVAQLPPIEILHWPTIVKYAEYFMKHELNVTDRTEGRLAEFKKAGTAINNATNMLNMQNNNIINSVLGDCL